MYKEIEFSSISKELLEQLQKGAFLTVKNGDKVNTMTIAWGALGFIWAKPVFTAMVRKSRYTHDLIENVKDFTVSMPLKGQLKEALKTCGTRSGRDMDKFKECNLTLKDGKYVNTPIIDNCDLHIECKIVFKQSMDEKLVSDDVKARAYSNGDYHDLYYGEILGIYKKE